MKVFQVKFFAVVVLAAAVMWLCPAVSSAIEVTFDDLTLSPNSYWNGSDNSGGFTSKGAYFWNSYSPPYPPYDEYWSGWSYSNMTDTSTPGYDNQYSAITGGGQGSSANYGVAYTSSWAPASVVLPSPSLVSGAYFTNTTYAYLAVRYGDDGSPWPFVRDKFGWWDANEDGDYSDPGDYNGNYPDWFELTIEGSLKSVSTGSVVFYLADYRFDENDKDYVVDDWTWVDLSGLGQVDTLKFYLSSTDNGTWGMNTPSYFAMDGLQYVPEPSSLILSFLAFSAIMLWRLKRKK